MFYYLETEETENQPWIVKNLVIYLIKYKQVEIGINLPTNREAMLLYLKSLNTLICVPIPFLSWKDNFL